MDRREFPRVPYGAWVEDETEGGLSFYLARNVSEGGLLLSSKGPRPAIGSGVRLRLVIENEARVIAVTGQVVRHSSGDESEFGVQFTDLDATRQTFLRELVNEADNQSDRPGTE